MDKGGKNWLHHMLLFSKHAFFPRVNSFTGRRIGKGTKGEQDKQEEIQFKCRLGRNVQERDHKSV